MEVDGTDVSPIKEKINRRIGHSRSVSTGRIGASANWKVKLVPSRYLETRFGSCHDHCKHGKELPGDGKVKGKTSRRVSAILGVGDKKPVIDELVIPINGDKSCLADERDASSQHSKETEASSGVSVDHEAKPVTDEKTEVFQHSNATECLPDLAGSPSDGRDSETRAAFPLTRTASSCSKVGLRRPRIKSIAYKGKVLVPTTILDSARTPKSTKFSENVKGKVPLPTTTAAVRIRSVHGVSSRAGKNFKHTTSALSDDKCNTVSVPGKSRSYQGSMFLTKTPTSSGNGINKISNSGNSVTSHSSSAASSSRPSTRRTTKKGTTVTGSVTAPKSRPKGAAILNSEDRPDSSHNVLQFRRGKLVDPKPEKVTAPRRLRFRQARTIGENQHGTNDTARKSSKTTEANALEAKNGTRERVVLRHRNLERAKNVQSLFNNVIEETASKLVKSRKSKVKALVGAFETVILLQDSQPKATIRAR